MSAIEQTFDPVDMFCRYLTSLGRADGTVDLYRNAITLTQRHLGAGTDLLAASGAELKRVYMLSDWAATLAPQTKITYGRFVATYLEWAAHDAELIEQAPTAALRGYLGQIKPGQQGLPTFLPYAELERLATQLWTTSFDPQRNVAVFWVMAGAGARLTETLRLHTDDLDLEDDVVRFIRHTKGGRERLVPLNPVVRRALKDWLRVRVHPSDVLFNAAWGGPYLAPRDVQKLLHRVASQLVDEQGRPMQRWLCHLHDNACKPKGPNNPDGCTRGHWRVHPHTLRHSFAVESLRSGACTLVELRDMLGHESIATTNIYANAVKDEAATTRFKRRWGRGGT